MDLDRFGKAYLQLVLEIEKHIPGYIDAYLGPVELQAAVSAGEKRPPVELVAELAKIQQMVPSADKDREAYLNATLRAIGGTLMLLEGQELAYLEEVATLFDIRPTPAEETSFTEAHKELDRLLPGTGTIAERQEQRRKAYELPAAKMMPAMNLAIAEVRRRTSQLFSLANGEQVDLAVVRDQPWSAYNWYLGNAKSLVEFNQDVPAHALGILPTMAHETYPGHHTEGQLKEAELWHQRGYAEHAAFLLHSPAAVISEGIATTALEIVFPNGSHHQWNLEVLLPAVGVTTEESAEQMARIVAAERALRYVSGNAAYYYHTGAFTRDQTLDYMQTYGLTNPVRAAKSFQFFTDPLFSSYIYTYTSGYDLIAGANGNDKTELFGRLLREQILPSQLADNITPEKT